MRFLAWVLVASLLPGCSRDLSLPSADRLMVALPFDVMAPREKMTLSARGGAGSGYSFDFAPNGQLSGSRATLSPAGEYQAGERGLAQDVVRVTDAAGAFADARVTVTSALTISPALSSVAPGGRLTFVASGGKPPWRFTLEGGAVMADGAYQAGPTGSRVDEIVLTDATEDPLATARAQVSVGSALVLYPGISAVAPRERLSFVGLGGQPPYSFSIDPASTSGGASPPTIDSATGLYQAGSNERLTGDALDLVVITDANGQRAQATVTVGRPLVVTAATTFARPGSPVTLLASGGKAPWSFSFQPRGNRSRGTVEAIVGTYVPGRNTGAVDLLQVTDATGTVATCAPFTVGPLQIAVPQGGTQVVGTDLDGDQLPDLVLLDSAGGAITTVLNPTRAYQSVSRLNVAVDSPLQLFVFDVNGDGRSDVVTPGFQSVDVFLGRFGGALDLQPLTVMGGGGAARSGLSEHWLYRWRRTLPCSGIERLNLLTAADTSPVAQCLQPGLANVFSVGAGQTGGATFVNWVIGDPPVSGVLPSASGPFEFRYLDTASPPAVTRSAQLPLPPGHRLLKLARSVTARAVDTIIDDAAQAGPSRMLVLVNDVATGVSRLWGVDTSGPAQAFAPYEVPTQFPAAGIAATQGPDGRPLVVAWDGRTGTLPIMRVEPDAGPSVSQTVEQGYPVFAANFVDMDRDGQADLVTSGYFVGKVDIVLGDGDGTFGRRPRFGAEDTIAPALLDVDGDGATDVVMGASEAAQVLWGIAENRQFAVGPRTSMARTPSRYFLGDLAGAGRVDLFFQDTQGALFFAPGTAVPGAFGAPQPILNPGGTQDLAISSPFTPGDFGGAASGPDLVTTLRDPVTSVLSPGILVRTATTIAKRLIPVPPPVGSPGACSYMPVNVDGAGVDDLVAACGDLVFIAISSGSGAGLGFGAWTAWSGNPLQGFSTGWVTPPPGSTHVFLGTGEALMDFAVVGGALTATRRAFPSQLDHLFFGNVYPVATGGEPDLVAYDFLEGAVRVLSWSGSGWVVRQSIGTGMAVPVGVITSAVGAPSDVLLATETDLVPLINDGTGRLR